MRCAGGDDPSEDRAKLNLLEAVGTPTVSVTVVPGPLALTLSDLRRILAQDPPIGAEIALACGYNPKQLAEMCDCSTRDLQRVFREFGRTPTRWLQEHRLLRDLRVLERLKAEGRLDSIEHAVSELGYTSLGSFDRAFKTTFGVSLTAFLNEWEAALKILGVDLAECRRKGRSLPLVDLPMSFLVNRVNLGSPAPGLMFAGGGGTSRE